MRKGLFKRAWNSPTLMTWLSYFVKSANLLLIIPLILKYFKAPEISIWFLFATMLTMSDLSDLGFRNTFVRLFAHAFGGSQSIQVHTSGDKTLSTIGPNWSLIERLYSAMQKIYRYLSIFLFIALLLFGSLSMIKPISQTQNQIGSWAAWFVIMTGITVNFYGKTYMNYLEGLFEIPMVRRVEAIFRTGSMLSSFMVLFFFPSLLNLSIAQSIWMVINCFRDRFLARRVHNHKLIGFRSQPLEKAFLLQIWRPAWRNGLATFISTGVLNLTSVFYAQVGKAQDVAAYTLSLRIINEIRNVASAPLYSKIPLLARLRVERNREKLVHVAQRGMQLANIIFIAGVIVVAMFFEKFIQLWGSNIKFVDAKFWLLLSLAFYIHRYGAMHMQIYLTTNHIISHIADGVSGTIFIGVMLALLHYAGIYAMPIAMICGYLLFYSWYASYHSLKSMQIDFFTFEYKVTLVPAILFITYTIISLMLIK